MTFESDFAAILKRAGDKADEVVRKSALDVGVAMVMRTPVDTGALRGNWQYGNGSINGATNENDIDKDGNKSIERIGAVLAHDTDKDIFITNSMPYAKKIEYGWSRVKAPNGMVRVTVREFADYVKAQADKVRNE